MFKTLGAHQLVIDEIKFAEPRFADGKGPEAFDICFKVHSEAHPEESDWIRVEHSDSYGKGNFQTQKQSEHALKTLRGIGFDSDDLSLLIDEMTGKTVAGYAKESKPNKDGKVFVNVYFGSSGGAEPSPESTLSVSDVMKRIGKAFGQKHEAASSGTVQTEASKPAAAAASGTPGFSPFKKK